MADPSSTKICSEHFVQTDYSSPQSMNNLENDSLSASQQTSSTAVVRGSTTIKCENISSDSEQDVPLSSGIGVRSGCPQRCDNVALVSEQDVPTSSITTVKIENISPFSEQDVPLSSGIGVVSGSPSQRCENISSVSEQDVPTSSITTVKIENLSSFHELNVPPLSNTIKVEASPTVEFQNIPLVPGFYVPPRSDLALLGNTFPAASFEKVFLLSEDSSPIYPNCKKLKTYSAPAKRHSIQSVSENTSSSIQDNGNQKEQNSSKHIPTPGKRISSETIPTYMSPKIQNNKRPKHCEPNKQQSTQTVTAYESPEIQNNKRPKHCEPNKQQSTQTFTAYESPEIQNNKRPNDQLNPDKQQSTQTVTAHKSPEIQVNKKLKTYLPPAKRHFAQPIAGNKTTIPPKKTAKILDPIWFRNWNVNCRLCFKYISSMPECLRDKGQFTELGLQFSLLAEVQESNYEGINVVNCCGECAVKIRTCFKSKVEMCTMESFILSANNYFTFTKTLDNSKLIHKDKHIITCKECLTDIQGIPAFIDHTTQHLMKPNTKRDTEEATNIDEDLMLNRHVELDYFENKFEYFSDREKRVLYHDINDDDDVLSDVMTDDDDDVMELVHEELEYHDDTDSDDVFKDSDLEIIDNKYKCPKCHLRFVYKFELRYHIVRHNLPCSEADVLGVFPKGDRIRRSFYNNLRRKEKLKIQKQAEQKSVTLDKKEFKSHVFCRYCNNLFERGSIFRTHADNCRETYMRLTTILCSHCGVKVKASQYNKNHHCKKNRQNQECHKCKKYFTGESVNRHKPCYEFDRITCYHCGKLIVKQKLTDHIRRKHNVETKFNCPLCETSLSYNYEIDAHLLVHRNYEVSFERICGRCNSHFTDLREYQDHLVNDHHVYENMTKKCEYCQKNIVDHDFKNHLITQHNIIQQKPKRKFHRRCYFCKKVVSQELMIKHQNICKQTKPKCPICHGPHVSEKIIDWHLCKHKTTNTTFQRDCSFCGDSFNLLSDFQKHIIHKHPRKYVLKNFKNKTTTTSKKKKKLNSLSRECVDKTSPKGMKIDDHSSECVGKTSPKRKKIDDHSSECVGKTSPKGMEMDDHSSEGKTCPKRMKMDDHSSESVGKTSPKGIEMDDHFSEGKTSPKGMKIDDHSSECVSKRMKMDDHSSEDNSC